MSAVDEAGIRGTRVRLRAIRREDLETLRGFVNDPEVMQFSNRYRPIGEQAQQEWYEEIARARDSVWFALDDVRSGNAKLVGTCCLVGIDWVSRLAELRIRIGDKSAWGGGLGSEATQLLVRYGFEDLNLERVWLRVFETNPRAIRMYEKLGFVHEGRWRRASFIGGKMVDVLLMAMLRDEWGERKESEVGGR